jgi:4-amino-4-deoxy-L-arabinose transferase-like glycosyltransferase
LPFLPLFLFPWLFWPRFWTNLRGSRFFEDKGLRFCAVWLFSSFIIFSLLPSKQIHYLIPMLPAFALLAARILANMEAPRGLLSELFLPVFFGLVGVFLVLLPQVPGLSKLNWVQTVEADWGLSVLAIAAVLAVVTIYVRKLTVVAVSTALVAAIFVGFIFFFQYTGLAYNLRPAALKLKDFNEQGIPCAFVGDYQGQLHFLGRLTQALPTLRAEQATAWAGQHADGYLISLERQKPAEAAYLQPHREYWLVFRTAQQAAQLKPL